MFSIKLINHLFVLKALNTMLPIGKPPIRDQDSLETVPRFPIDIKGVEPIEDELPAGKKFRYSSQHPANLIAEENPRYENLGDGYVRLLDPYASTFNYCVKRLIFPIWAIDLRYGRPLPGSESREPTGLLRPPAGLRHRLRLEQERPEPCCARPDLPFCLCRPGVRHKEKCPMCAEVISETPVCGMTGKYHVGHP